MCEIHAPIPPRFFLELAAAATGSPSRDQKHDIMFLNLTTDHLPDDSLGEQTPRGIYIFAAIALSFIGFFGFILNLLIILTIVKNANVLWTPNNIMLVNMAVSIR